MGRAFGTYGKTEDKSAAVNSTIPVFQQTRDWRVLVQNGPHGVLTAQMVDSPFSLPVIAVQGLRRIAFGTSSPLGGWRGPPPGKFGPVPQPAP